MFNGWITSWLSSALSGFIKAESLARQNVSTSLLSGKVVVTDVELQEDAFDGLELPFTMVKGTVSRLQVSLPWPNSGLPLAVVAEGVHLVVRPFSDDDYESRKEKLPAMAPPPPPASQPGYIGGFFASYVNNLSVSVEISSGMLTFCTPADLPAGTPPAKVVLRLGLSLVLGYQDGELRSVEGRVQDLQGSVVMYPPGTSVVDLSTSVSALASSGLGTASRGSGSAGPWASPSPASNTNSNGSQAAADATFDPRSSPLSQPGSATTPGGGRYWGANYGNEGKHHGGGGTNRNSLSNSSDKGAYGRGEYASRHGTHPYEHEHRHEHTPGAGSESVNTSKNETGSGGSSGSGNVGGFPHFKGAALPSGRDYYSTFRPLSHSDPQSVDTGHRLGERAVTPPGPPSYSVGPLTAPPLSVSGLGSSHGGPHPYSSSSRSGPSSLPYLAFQSTPVPSPAATPASQARRGVMFPILSPCDVVFVHKSMSLLDTSGGVQETAFASSSLSSTLGHVMEHNRTHPVHIIVGGPHGRGAVPPQLPQGAATAATAAALAAAGGASGIGAGATAGAGAGAHAGGITRVGTSYASGIGPIPNFSTTSIRVYHDLCLTLSYEGLCALTAILGGRAPPSAPQPPMPPACGGFDVVVRNTRVLLVNPSRSLRDGSPEPVVETHIKGLRYTLLTSVDRSSATLTLQLCMNYYNSHLAAYEPMVELWPVKASLSLDHRPEPHHTVSARKRTARALARATGSSALNHAAPLAITITSDEVLSVNITEALLDTLGHAVVSIPSHPSTADAPAVSPSSSVAHDDSTPSNLLFGYAATVSLDFEGLGVSLVDSRPRELLYGRMSRLTAVLMDSKAEKRLNVKLGRLEIDNQEFDTPYPVLLAPLNGADRLFGFVTPPNKAFAEFSVNLASPGPAAPLRLVQSCVLRVAPVDIALDGVLLTDIIDMVFRVKKHWEPPTASEGAFLQRPASLGDLVKDDDPQQLSDPEPAAAPTPWYFEQLAIFATAANITFDARGALSGPLAAVGSIENAQLSLPAVTLSQTVAPLPALQTRIAQHYEYALRMQWYKILASLTVVRIPTSVMGMALQTAAFLSKFFSKSFPSLRSKIGLPQIQSKLERKRMLRIRPPRYFRDSHVPLRSYCLEENEGEDLLGRAGDGIFKRETYIAHWKLPCGTKSVVVSNAGILCVSTAVDTYYSLHWRVGFRHVRFFRLAEDSVTLFCMPCRARGVSAAAWPVVPSQPKTIALASPSSAPSVMAVEASRAELVPDSWKPQRLSDLHFSFPSFTIKCRNSDSAKTLITIAETQHRRFNRRFRIGSSIGVKWLRPGESVPLQPDEQNFFQPNPETTTTSLTARISCVVSVAGLVALAAHKAHTNSPNLHLSL